MFAVMFARRVIRTRAAHQRELRRVRGEGEQPSLI
jgi:hypothetical protein